MAIDPKVLAKYKAGQLNLIDAIPQGDPDVAGALCHYANGMNGNHSGQHVMRGVGWVENMMFGLGRHYMQNILQQRLSVDSSDNLSLNQGSRHRVPQPTTDILGQYIETNIALFTENRPIPRITPMSGSLDDKHSAEFSELNVDYLWEKLNAPEKVRELVRLALYNGTSFADICYDPLIPRYMQVPETRREPTTPLESGIMVPVPRDVPVVDEKTGAIKMRGDVQYGDLAFNVVSAFEMHVPPVHWWNGEDMGWIMREFYMPIEVLKEKYGNRKVESIVTKRNGYFRENLEKIGGTQTHNYPLWWWNRFATAVEGPEPSFAFGGPEQADNYTIVRIFDRRPSADWPQGRTVITAGDQPIYDSPKRIGARAYDSRWPTRWHPYTRIRWEAIAGSVWGRSLVSKLLPKLKRINSIDANIIMWRRTVPQGQWILPRGSSPVESFHSGEPGSYIVYDPRRTAGAAPQPVYPPPFPQTILEERQMQIMEMESIAGTEKILRGQRPEGSTSAAMLQFLRNQALTPHSPILQAFDESLQEMASSMLQETIRHALADPSYKQRLQVLAREKGSTFSIDRFVNQNLSDNVMVRIDTKSMAMSSPEARQQRAIEISQFAEGLMALPTPLRAAIVSELGWPDILTPQGDDVSRARIMIQLVKSKRFDLAIPVPEDDPYVLHEMLVSETKKEAFFDYETEIQLKFYELVEYYRNQIVLAEQAKMQMMQEMAAPPEGAV